MKLIKPLEISARILTLLDESEERVIIVSPYMKISKWYKLSNKLKRLKNRGVPVDIYVRDDPSNTTTYEDLDELGFRYKKVPNLHCKLYLNERTGILSSMNLLLSSELNFIEIGCATENWEDYNELFDIFHRYIHSGKPVFNNTVAGQALADLNEIIRDIRGQHQTTANDSWTWFSKGALHICTGRNKYTISIIHSHLSITTSLWFAPGARKKSLPEPSVVAKKISGLTGMKTEAHQGNKPGIINLSGQSRRTLKSTCLTRILKNEANEVKGSVRRFIEATDNLMI